MKIDLARIILEEEAAVYCLGSLVDLVWKSCLSKDGFTGALDNKNYYMAMAATSKLVSMVTDFLENLGSDGTLISSFLPLSGAVTVRSTAATNWDTAGWKSSSYQDRLISVKATILVK